MGSNRGIVIEMEGVWNPGGMGMLSCMTVGIAMSVCVLVLVVVLVWMVLTMRIVMGVLAVAVEIVMVQRVLVEVNCMGVVSGSSSGGFVVLWSSWRMVLWCLNEREDFFGLFGLMLVVGNMLMAEGMCFFGMVIRWGFLDFFYFYNFLELMEVGVLVWWR